MQDRVDTLYEDAKAAILRVVEGDLDAMTKASTLDMLADFIGTHLGYYRSLARTDTPYRYCLEARRNRRLPVRERQRKLF